jgi:hypothetical protein
MKLMLEGLDRGVVQRDRTGRRRSVVLVAYRRMRPTIKRGADLYILSIR